MATQDLRDFLVDARQQPNISIQGEPPASGEVGKIAQDAPRDQLTGENLAGEGGSGQPEIGGAGQGASPPGSVSEPPTLRAASPLVQHGKRPVGFGWLPSTHADATDTTRQDAPFAAGAHRLANAGIGAFDSGSTLAGARGGGPAGYGVLHVNNQYGGAQDWHPQSSNFGHYSGVPRKPDNYHFARPDNSQQDMFLQALAHQSDNFMQAIKALQPTDSSKLTPATAVPSTSTVVDSGVAVASAVQTPPSNHTLSDGELSDTGSSGSGSAYEDKMDSFLQASEEASAEQEGADTDQNLFADLIQFFDQEEKVGKPVHDKLAEVVNSALRTKVPAEKEKSLLEAVHRPKNCNALVVPKVNPEIWGKLKRSTRAVDLDLQRIQSLLHKGLVPIIQLMDNLQGKDAPNMRLAGEAFRLAAVASYQLSQRRRESVAPDLSSQFRPLCSSSTPITALLFGDDLAKTVKDLSETQQVGAKVSGSGFKNYRKSYKGGKRFEPYSNKQYHPSKNNFLGGGKNAHHSRKRSGRRNNHGNNNNHNTSHNNNHNNHNVHSGSSNTNNNSR